MDLQLAGHTAVVVGAARGIGRAIAEAFAAESARVALLDRDPAIRDAAREVAAASPVQTLAVEVDVTSCDGLCHAAEQIEKQWDRIDHVVYCVAVGSGKVGPPFWNVEPADWSQVLQVNVVGAVHTAHAFAPALIRSRSGTLLFLGSVAGQIGSQTDPPYSASKAALMNFAQCAARDLALHGVRVNTLCPGMVRTPLMQSIYEAWLAEQPEENRLSFADWSRDKIQRLVPLNRWQEPEDIAAMAVFLSSPRARQVTGQTVNVDGGYVMR
jgi:NAD(P)-dependent dehydrogenase (short-subunit alcohol dehydrogenase family)